MSRLELAGSLVRRLDANHLVNVEHAEADIPVEVAAGGKVVTDDCELQFTNVRWVRPTCVMNDLRRRNGNYSITLVSDVVVVRAGTRRGRVDREVVPDVVIFEMLSVPPQPERPDTLRAFLMVHGRSLHLPHTLSNTRRRYMSKVLDKPASNLATCYTARPSGNEAKVAVQLLRASGAADVQVDTYVLRERSGFDEGTAWKLVLPLAAFLFLISDDIPEASVGDFARDFARSGDPEHISIFLAACVPAEGDVVTSYGAALSVASAQLNVPKSEVAEFVRNDVLGDLTPSRKRMVIYHLLLMAAKLGVSAPEVDRDHFRMRRVTTMGSKLYSLFRCYFFGDMRTDNHVLALVKTALKPVSKTGGQLPITRLTGAPLARALKDAFGRAVATCFRAQVSMLQSRKLRSPALFAGAAAVQ